MHKQFILAAFEQAWLGRGWCSPNPSVGAIAVHNNQIIARAWHKKAGSAHAELEVLRQLPPGLKNVTLYVTLEPCNHWGKTPPCVETIISYGVSSVVYSFRDPNPLVQVNNTPKILEENGIETIYFPIPEVTAFYQSYQYWINHAKPYITVKMAHTLDGKIAKKNGERIQLSNQLCSEFTHFQRLHSDLILTTAQTIIKDNPSLLAISSGTSYKKNIAILDTTLAIPENAQIYDSAAHCHIFYDEKLCVKKTYTNRSYHPMPLMSNKRIDLSAFIDYLGRLGFHDVWVESGGTLFSALHHQGLVQKTYLYIVPNSLGEEATSGFYGQNLFNRPHTISWESKENNMIACIEWQEEPCLLE